MIRTFPEFLRRLFQQGAALRILTYHSSNPEDTNWITTQEPYVICETSAYQVPWWIVEWLEEIGWLIRVNETAFRYDYEFVAFYNNWKDNH